jgi:hypothetical protein
MNAPCVFEGIGDGSVWLLGVKGVWHGVVLYDVVWCDCGVRYLFLELCQRALQPLHLLWPHTHNTTHTDTTHNTTPHTTTHRTKTQHAHHRSSSGEHNVHTGSFQSSSKQSLYTTL